MEKLDVVIPFNLDAWPYHHPSMPMGQALDYYGTDTKPLYQRNLKYLPNNWKYRDEVVSYNFNSSGLRMQQELDTIKDYILFSGTSYTFGLGINEADRFSNIISNKLNLDFINFAGPTYSVKMQVISFFNLLKSNFILPSVMVIEYPPTCAYTWYENGNFLFTYSKHLPTDYKKHVDAHTSLLATEFHLQEANMFRNMLIGTCKRLGIKLLEVSLFKNEQFAKDNNLLTIDTDTNSDDINFCYGRDIRIQPNFQSGHPGAGIHNLTANELLKLL